MKVNIHEKDKREKKYAVIISYEKGKLVLVRHRERITWEIPGGHREEGEDIMTTAKRELFEETGAIKYEIKYLCDYSVENNSEINYGGLFIADIYDRRETLHHEIEEIRHYYELPEIEKMTYGKIQKELVRSVEENYREFIPKVL